MLGKNSQFNLKHQIISSVQNSQIKLLKKLGDKKYRQKLGLFCIENLVIIADALKGGYDFEALFFTADLANKNKEAFGYIMEHSGSRNFYLIDEKINKHYSDLDTPSGITAIYKVRENVLDDGRVVYLNGVRDPGNLGAIMRNALAFGFINLVLDKDCVDIYNPKVLTATKDAIFKLNILRNKDINWLKDEIVKKNIALYSADVHNGQDVAGFKPAHKFCLVLGSESHGIDQEILKISSDNLKIVISEKIESLNVASAGAILFYQLNLSLK